MNTNTQTDAELMFPTETTAMDLQKLTCQHCKAEFLVQSATSTAACNFCGTQLSFAKEPAAISPPESILPFIVKKEQYQQILLTWLSEGEYTPDDILSSSAFGEVNGIYAPMHVYEGAYHGRWSATSGYKRQIKQYEKDSEGQTVEKIKTVTDWRPSSGQVAGEFRVLVFAGVHTGIKAEMVQFASDAECAEKDLEPFDLAVTAGFNLLEFDGDDNMLWEAAGHSKAETIARLQIIQQIPGDEHKNLQHDLSWDRSPARKVYLPCWFLSYKYKDQPFHVCLDGRNAGRIDGVRPEDQNRIAQVKKYFLPAHIIAGASFALWGLLQLCQSGFSGTIFWLGALFTAGMYGVAFYRKKKLVNTSRARRQEILRVHQTAAGFAPTSMDSSTPKKTGNGDGLLSPLVAKLSKATSRWDNWKGWLKDRCMKPLRRIESKLPGNHKQTS